MTDNGQVNAHEAPAAATVSLADLDTRMLEQLRNLLLSQHFTVALNHYEQAVAAIERGHSESANAQVRAFLEALCDQISRHLERGNKRTGGAARQFMQRCGFIDENEAQLLQSLMRVLHGQGPHPGTSTKEDSRRRLLMASALGQFYVEQLIQHEEGKRAEANRLENLVESVVGGVSMVMMLTELMDLDHERLSIEGEDIALEIVRAYGRSRSLGVDWFSEWDQLMSQRGLEWGLVVSERAVDQDLTWLEPIADGVHTRFGTVVVLASKHDDETIQRLNVAKDWFAREIRMRATKDKNRER